MTTGQYKGGYTVVDQRSGGPDYDVMGQYDTLDRAWNRARHTNGACVIRTQGTHYDLEGARTVSSLVQRCGVLADGTTFAWPA